MLARRAMAFEIAVALLAASVAFGYKSDFDVAVFDEGLALYGGMRVGGGDVPYRDFWTTYAPGSYYLAAGAFDVFGASAAVVRYLWLGLHVAIAVLTLILARQ